MFARREASPEKSLEGFATQNYIWHRIDLKYAAYVTALSRLLADHMEFAGDNGNLNAQTLHMEAKM